MAWLVETEVETSDEHDCVNGEKTYSTDGEVTITVTQETNKRDEPEAEHEQDEDRSEVHSEH